MSMTAWCNYTKSTTSSITKLRVMPSEENSRTGFKMLPTALLHVTLVLPYGRLRTYIPASYIRGQHK